MPEGDKETSDKKGFWKLLLFFFVPLAILILYFVIQDAACSG